MSFGFIRNESTLNPSSRKNSVREWTSPSVRIIYLWLGSFQTLSRWISVGGPNMAYSQSSILFVGSNVNMGCRIQVVEYKANAKFRYANKYLFSA